MRCHVADPAGVRRASPVASLGDDRRRGERAARDEHRCHADPTANGAALACSPPSTGEATRRAPRDDLRRGARRHCQACRPAGHAERARRPLRRGDQSSQRSCPGASCEPCPSARAGAPSHVVGGGRHVPVGGVAARSDPTVCATRSGDRFRAARTTREVRCSRFEHPCALSARVPVPAHRHACERNAVRHGWSQIGLVTRGGHRARAIAWWRQALRPRLCALLSRRPLYDYLSFPRRSASLILLVQGPARLSPLC